MKLALGSSRRTNRSCRTRSVLLTVLASAAVASACGDTGSSSTTTPSSTASSAPITSPTTTRPSTTPPPTTPPSTAQVPTTTSESPAPDVEVIVAVAPDGLLLVRADNGSTTMLTFGTPRDQVMQALTATIGPPANAGAASGECPNEEDYSASWDQALAVSFKDDALLSWSLRPGSSITDIAGIGLGSTVAEINEVLQIEIAPSSLGTEFHTVDATGTSGYGGLLTGDADDSVVTDLWAGLICAFR